MQRELMTYSGMTAKIKAMRGRLLKNEDYYTIASMQSVAEFQTWLKNAPGYARVFDHVQERGLHRGDIEKLLQLALYEDYGRIYTFAGPNQRRFLKVFFKRYEIQIIKTFLHLIFDHRDIAFDTSLIPRHFTEQSDVDLDAMSRCRSLEDFFETIGHSEYYPLLISLKDAPGTSLFDYELALDIHFFRYLWKLKDKVLKKTELKEITRIYGTQMDLLNILWIYRSKRYYRVDPAEMYGHLIPIHFRLTVPFLRRLIECETIAEYMELLGRSSYGQILRAMETSAADSDTAVWKLYQDTMKKLHRSAARKYPYSLAMIDDYLYLREDEINRLTTALECIRYGLDSSRIVGYLM